MTATHYTCCNNIIEPIITILEFENKYRAWFSSPNRHRCGGVIEILLTVTSVLNTPSLGPASTCFRPKILLHSYIQLAFRSPRQSRNTVRCRIMTNHDYTTIRCRIYRERWLYQTPYIIYIYIIFTRYSYEPLNCYFAAARLNLNSRLNLNIRVIQTTQTKTRVLYHTHFTV